MSPSMINRDAGSWGGMWPTPSATPRGAHTGAISGSVAEDGMSRVSSNGTKWGATLETAVKMWPTPTQDSVSERTKKYAHGGTPLPLAVKMWPTPTVQDSANNGAPSQYERNSLPLNAVAGGALNPTWVEWLMGYDLGWTDCED
tara:strand:- start:324 stop:755 length:432 start_codon:yes stop_codon:yes gene_type:complete